MTAPVLVPEHSITAGVDEEGAPPRADLKDAVGWIVFGAAVLVGSVTMDRLEAQNINPVTAPGLLPGLLGIAMILLGSALGVRSWRRGALARAMAQRYYPEADFHLIKSHNRAEAVLIARYGHQKYH